MKKLLIVVMACYALNVSAQTDGSRNFIYLYSDSVIYAKKVMLRPDFLGSLQLRVDSRRIPTEQVKFFNNETGFFANTRKLTFSSVNLFSERVIEGRINLFQRASYDPFLYDQGYRYRRNRQTAVDLRMYYNKGFGDLKKVSYNNLKDDMADHPESMDLLNGYRKSMNTSKLLYTAAGVSVAAGLISFLVNANSNQKSDAGFSGPGSSLKLKRVNMTPAFLLLGLGGGLAVGGFSVRISASRKLESAVEAYNLL